MKFTISAALLAAAIQASDYAECPHLEHLVDFDTPEYQAQSAYCKQQMIWRNVIKDRTPQQFFVGEEFDGFFKQDMNLSFDSVSDTMPPGRIKRTHPVGTTTLMEFIPTYDTPYTGIFQGCKHAVMRISEFATTVPQMAHTTPGHGVKFLRDGMASANWFAMFAFDGQTSFNFFKNRWTNILREMENTCARETIGKHLNEVSDHTGGMSVMELAQFDQYGNEVKEPHWPFQIEVEPYDVYGWTDEYQNDFLDQLSFIPADTVMFKIFGFDCPPEHHCEEKLIGHLVSRSETTSSLWGDEMLFF
jgi:hypothetical protein